MLSTNMGWRNSPIRNHTGNIFVSTEVLQLSVYLNKQPTDQPANQQTNQVLSCTRMTVASTYNEEYLPR
jgi:hypothetical protein